MNSKALIAHLFHPAADPQEQKKRFLHRVSDSWLHTALLVALAVLAGVVLYKAVTLTIEIWQLEPVVVDVPRQAPGAAKR